MPPAAVGGTAWSRQHTDTFTALARVHRALVTTLSPSSAAGATSQQGHPDSVPTSAGLHGEWGKSAIGTHPIPRLAAPRYFCHPNATSSITNPASHAPTRCQRHPMRWQHPCAVGHSPASAAAARALGQEGGTSASPAQQQSSHSLREQSHTAHTSTKTGSSPA